MGMYESLLNDELNDFQYSRLVSVADNNSAHTKQMPLWIEVAALMAVVIIAILSGVRSRSNREVPE